MANERLTLAEEQMEDSAQRIVALAMLAYLRKQLGTAENCNLIEQIHAAFFDCQPCQARWDGTTFRPDGKVYEP